ncbi:hypothetical protein [Paracoccus benzoatiresistens]|uniref:PepSY domain-containing protein n=1 Tax=Paracoccus benzoatiresistens TaxID=2997341 RepID=A0ABT4J4Z2_9RHOB|nr:hypothetical protein [Paracoccus sp. EF6]MCZ0961715.1 hypothetical protein [Paracoccus sp. EF6]
MAIHRFTTSAAMLALVAGLGSAAMAQTAPSGADLPAPLAGLNLNSLEIDTDRNGMREIEGRTADGVDIEARIDRDNNLVKVEADDGVLPQSLVDAIVPAELRGHQALALFTSMTEIRKHPEGLMLKGRQSAGDDIAVRFDSQNRLTRIDVDNGAVPAELANTLLPQAIRENELIGQFARIEEIGTRESHVMLRGEDASGEDMRAMFDADGRVLRFGREDDDGPRGERGHGRNGDHDHEHGLRMGDREHGEHGRHMGERGHEGHGMHGEHGPRGDRPMGDGPRGDGPAGDGPAGDGRRAAGPAPVPADFDAVAVNQKLTQAGYKEFGLLRADGPRLMLEATNPQGESVMLELDPKGELVRETARQAKPATAP